MSADDQAALALESILAKKQGQEISAASISRLIPGYLQGSVSDAQMASLLMAICWRGMSAGEIDAWTEAMISSGIRQDLSCLTRPTVDKHSTGGVGDKVSLILAPLVAACGAAVPQLSGRGLGHTGGTLDKMESIAGWQAELTPGEMLKILEQVGCVICSASPDLAPADRRLYALRDATGTVESISLIASSIMSKKIAEGTGALLLDVKVGSGAFMPTIGEARELARTMLHIGSRHGVRTRALLTEMDTPLGQAVGNAVEVQEAIDVLQGQGPPDLRDLVLRQAREMLDLVGLDADAERALDNGGAWESFKAMVRAQGGDPEAPLPQGSRLSTVPAETSGFITKLDARAVGVAAWRLGAGRARPGDPVSATAGVLCLATVGDWVERGQPVLELVGGDGRLVPHSLQALAGAIEIQDRAPDPRPKVLEVASST